MKASEQAGRCVRAVVGVRMGREVLLGWVKEEVSEGKEGGGWVGKWEGGAVGWA